MKFNLKKILKGLMWKWLEATMPVRCGNGQEAPSDKL